MVQESNIINQFIKVHCYGMGLWHNMYNIFMETSMLDDERPVYVSLMCHLLVPVAQAPVPALLGVAVAQAPVPALLGVAVAQAPVPALLGVAVAQAPVLASASLLGVADSKQKTI